MRAGPVQRGLCAGFIALTWAALAWAEPRFEAHPSALPVTHVYSGGWEHFVGGGVAAFDCNGDGLRDLYIAGGTSPARLFVNRSQAEVLRFELADEGPTGVTGAYPLDIDSDGNMDLAVLRVGHNQLLQGDGACGFTTPQWGFVPGDAWSTAFSATWEPEAAWPTLAIGNYVDRRDPEGPFEACDSNELHRPVSADIGFGFGAPITLAPGFCALSMLFSDWDRSGRAALRISNDRHYYVRGGSEQMWTMDPLRLLDPLDGWDPISIWGMGIASRDITGDGRPEVALTSMGDQLLLLSTPDGYRPAPYEMGTTAHRPHIGDDGRPSTGWHAAWGDVDNDGLDDLFIAKGNVDQMPSNAMADPNTLLRQASDGTFDEVAAAAGIATTDRARGAVLADLDLDGRLDLVVVNRRAPVEVWRNVTSEPGNWIAVELHQDGANPNAVGAWIEARSETGRWLREITIGGGHAGGLAGPAHFGLGPDTNAQIRVTWPDGQRGPWHALAAGQIHRITAPRAEDR